MCHVRSPGDEEFPLEATMLCVWISCIFIRRALTGPGRIDECESQNRVDNNMNMGELLDAMMQTGMS